MTADLLGTVVFVAAPGTLVPAGGELAVLEAMKMQHPVLAGGPVEIVKVEVAAGDTVAEGAVLLTTRPHQGAWSRAGGPTLDA